MTRVTWAAGLLALVAAQGPERDAVLAGRVVWDALTSVDERDRHIDRASSSPVSPPASAEYRGRFGDGSVFRFVGTFGETVSYEHVSPEAESYFDRLLDALCWAGPPPASYEPEDRGLKTED